MRPRDATADDADAASAEASSCRLGEQEGHSTSPRPTAPTSELPSSSSSSTNPLSSTAGPLPESSSSSGRTSFPISFFFQRGKVPSASLASSTAEGKPVPLTDTTGTHHTSALQKLNSKYPSAVRRHGYTETTGPQSSTYSQPVLVRTYSGPSLSQASHGTHSSRYRPPSSSRGVSRRVPLPSSSTSSSGDLAGQPIQPTVSGVVVGTTSSISTSIDRHSVGTNGGNAHGVSMPRPYKAKKANSSSTKLPLPWQWSSSSQAPEEPKLPPLEAFSFKSFMADLQTRGSQNDIGADLDRIAEICARSRYSLSNQYEVHVAPHGSGASFTAGTGSSSSTAQRRKKGQSHSRGIGGPTLQAITSEDEGSTRSQPRRKNGGGRRRSAAYSTLETIMSSSRSSEEEKTKKKSATELVGEVRGRAARKGWGDNLTASSASASASASASTGNGGSGADADAGNDTEQQSQTDSKRLARKKSASFATAIMDSGRSSSGAKSSPSKNHRRRTTTSSAAAATPTAPASALLSEPALPQTSKSHLGVRTTVPGAPASDTTSRSARLIGGLPRRQQESTILPTSQPGLVSGGATWSAWIPWGQGQGQGQDGSAGLDAQPPQSHAEGSLRQLLGR